MKTRISAFLAIVTAVVLMTDGVHAEKHDHTIIKSNQRSVSKSGTALTDQPNHEVFQETLISAVRSSNPEFKLTEEWVFNQVDQVDGSGTHRGYYINFHQGGEMTYGTYQGTHKTVAKDDGSWLSTWEGKHQLTGGTGKYRNIKGSGTYKGRVGSKEAFYEEAREQVDY